MGFLQHIGASEDIKAKAAASKKANADLEAASSSEGFPEFKLADKATTIISIAPGCGSFGSFAGVYSDGDIEQWVEEQAAAQLTKLGYKPGDEIPAECMIPEYDPNKGVATVLFVGAKKVKGSGHIDYSAYPASVLRTLPEDHPRRKALSLQGKFGESKVKTYVYLYCIEHSMRNGKLDNDKLAADIEAGGFLKLLKLNGPSYSALKAATQAARMSGAQFIPGYHLVAQWADFEKKTYNFNTNPMAPAWHEPSMLRKVLKEVHRVGPPIEHADVRRPTDEEFAALVEQLMPTELAG